MTKFIVDNQEVIIDDEDAKFFMENRWNITNGYVRKLASGRTKTRYLHQFISGIYDGRVDHINRNRLDNRKENLRRATHSQNLANRGLQSNNTSGYKGVRFRAERGTYEARIKVTGVELFIGSYKTAVEAAQAYNQRALIEFGEFANLNKI